MNKAGKMLDSDLQRAVLEELKWDARVKETDVGVETKQGVVTLTGTVESWTERLAAQEAAHRVKGVLDVANDIRVIPPGSFERTDTDLARALRQALEWDVLVPHERIQSTVTQGVVTLEGKVTSWSQYDDAGRCVRNLAGIREVRNHLQVEPPKVAADKLRRSIEQALERHAEHTASKVSIGTTGNDVTLTGQVPSWSERIAIEGAVRGTPGVGKVANLLSVRI